jgi:hypothetical protein
MPTHLKTFGFLDETGNLSLNHPVRKFAVGAIIHPWPDELIINLHNVFTGFCSDMKKEPTRMEMKFNEVTLRSLPHYLKAIDSLERDPEWRFCSLVIDKDDPKFIQPVDKLKAWECYLRYVKLLLQRNIQSHEHMILLADFLRRPSGNVHTFATLPSVVQGLDDVLQVESQGILLVQMADILLGATMYTGVDVVKVQLKNRVRNLVASLNKRRFNEWKIIWK